MQGVTVVGLLEKFISFWVIKIIGMIQFCDIFIHVFEIVKKFNLLD